MAERLRAALERLDQAVDRLEKAVEARASETGEKPAKGRGERAALTRRLDQAIAQLEMVLKDKE